MHNNHAYFPRGELTQHTFTTQRKSHQTRRSHFPPRLIASDDSGQRRQIINRTNYNERLQTTFAVTYHSSKFTRLIFTLLVVTTNVASPRLPSPGLRVRPPSPLRSPRVTSRRASAFWDRTILIIIPAY